MLTISVDTTTASGLAETALRLGALPTEIPRAVKRSLDAGAQVLVGMARRDARRFKGKGPFPASQHRLGRVSQELWRQLFATQPRPAGSPGEYEIGFGSNARANGVNYFAIHEFGSKGTANVAAFTHPNLFGRGPAAIPAHTRRFNFPARAPMRTHLQQHADQVFTTALEQELEELVNNLS